MTRATKQMIARSSKEKLSIEYKKGYLKDFVPAKSQTSLVVHCNQVEDYMPLSLNEVCIILGGLIGLDTNYVRKVHAIGLEAYQELIHILQNHGKDKEPKMVGDDLVFTKKEITRLVHPIMMLYS